MKNNKIKIEVGYEKLTETDIKNSQNFDKVYTSYIKSKPPFYKNPLLIGSIVVITVVASIFIAGKYKANKVEENQQKNTAFINPPLKGVDVAFETYLVNTTNDTGLTTKSGSKIKIPKNVFVDKDGKDISGKVEIRYREFHDGVDFFLSGIPMTYDSGGTKYTFESAGMIEMQGFQNGQPIYIKSDKNIKVEMVSQQTEDKYNVYYLDTLKRNWQYKGRDEVAYTKTALPHIDKDDKPIKKLGTELVEIRKEIKKIESNKPLEPIKADEIKYQFSIDVDAKEFPELNIYKESLFEIAAENKNFQPKYADILWTDASLEKIEGGIKYNLTLTQGKDSHTFIVYPVFKGKNYDVALKEYDKKYKVYTTALQERKAEEKRKQEEYDQLVKRWKSDDISEEIKWKEQRDYAMKNTILENETVSETQNSITRVLNISGFGIWNCDRPAPTTPIGVALNAKYTDQQKNKLNINVVSLVEKGRNAIFNYNTSQSFCFNPSVENFALAVTKDNNIAVLSSDEFKKVNQKTGEYTFEMKVIDKKFENALELKTLLNL